MDENFNLTRDQILSKKFTPNVKGYDPDEVDDFLDLIELRPRRLLPPRVVEESPCSHICDGRSDCARGRNNPGYAGARNGGRISLVDRNPQGATETSLPAIARCNAANPTSEKPKFGRGSAQGKSKLREPASAEINCRPRHNMAYRVGTH
jgi:DivIVA domain-containing protein